MATIFTHAAVAGVIKSAFKKFQTNNKRILFWSLFLSILPDADVLAFTWGIPYEDPLGHRGFTHSILFALLVAPMVSYTIFKKNSSSEKRMLTLLFFLSLMSHGFLDAMTNGGLGIGFFIPFDNDRYFMPWTPIEVSPIGRNFFSKQGLITLLSEFKVVIIPLILVFAIKLGLKKIKYNQ